MNIAAIIAWIATNPEVIAKGADAVIGLVNTAIAIFKRHQQGQLTDEQLNAAWAAEGIDLAAAAAAADAAGL
jgi:hypothetical protein